MKIKFQQSGGIAGRHVACALDTTQLSPADRQQLESLVEQGDIRESLEKRTEQGRDLQQYEIHLEKGDKSYRIVVDDRSVPDKLKPLLKALQRHARLAPRP